MKDYSYDFSENGRDEAISYLLSDWKKVRADLEILYQNRDQKNTMSGMHKGIAIFIQYLYWTNDKPVIIEESITLNELDSVPVNLEERFAFILKRPNLYHSYRQLSELMAEQEKLYAKKSIQKKRLS